MAAVVLAKGRDRRLKAGHLWIYAGEIAAVDEGASPGDLVEVVGAAARVVARPERGPALPCPHGDCPGCPLLGLPYPEQLSAKARLVARTLAEQLHPLGAALPEVLPVRPSPQVVGYLVSGLR